MLKKMLLCAYFISTAVCAMELNVPENPPVFLSEIANNTDHALTIYHVTNLADYYQTKRTIQYSFYWKPSTYLKQLAVIKAHGKQIFNQSIHFSQIPNKPEYAAMFLIERTNIAADLKDFSKQVVTGGILTGSVSAGSRYLEIVVKYIPASKLLTVAQFANPKPRSTTPIEYPLDFNTMENINIYVNVLGDTLKGTQVTLQEIKRK
jgi:hypothetical protein